MRVCYFIDTNDIDIDDIMENDEVFKKFMENIAVNSALSKDIFTLFFPNDIEGHISAWKQAALDDYNFLALTDKHILDENFDITVYENLINEYDLLYNENCDFYIVSKKCCEKMQHFTGDSVKNVLHNIKEFKKDILTGV